MIRLTYSRRPLSLGRRLASDAFAHSCPHSIAAAERTMRLADVVAARAAASPRPSWGAIMTKAFALAARNHPEMRQVYLSFPWGHLCEYETQVAAVVVVRRVGDEDIVFLAPIRAPDQQPVIELDRQLRHFQEAPIAEIGAFRTALRIARLPSFLRRVLWPLGLNLPGIRLRKLGSYWVSTMSPFGAKALLVPTLGGPVVHYGALDDAGNMPVALVVDHRVLDGAVAGFTLMEMEQALHREIHTELVGLEKKRRAA